MTDLKLSVIKQHSKKTSYGKHVRNSDPKAWASLTDEQRDEILDWYLDICQKEHDEQESELNKRDNAMLLTFIPCAVIYGYETSGYTARSLEFLWNTAASYAFFVFAFMMLRELAIYIIDQIGKADTKKKKVYRVLKFIGVILVAVFATITLLYGVHHRYK